MDSRETKRTVPVPSAPTDGEQPISQTTAKSIAEETAENNPQEESLEEMLRDMRQLIRELIRTPSCFLKTQLDACG